MTQPLAEKLRPTLIEEMVGQHHLIGSDGWITRVIQSARPLSILLWGPPGCGKTTLARLYAKAFEAEFVPFSAVLQGVAELKKTIHEAKKSPLFHRQLVIFIDEIHRFNKAQQDALLPFVEKGEIILIGATTENPSFSLNNALLSRMHTLVLNPLTETDLQALMTRYEEKEEPLPLTEKAKTALIHLAAGDGRYLLNMIENLSQAPSSPLLNAEDLSDWVQMRAPLYDKGDEGHYNLISALHKSIRGSDPDAALYWLSRMLLGGEDPKYIARRLIRMASEDIGLADPDALRFTLDAWRSFEQQGSPEGEIALAEAAVYLALAPKSNALYKAFNAAWDLAKKTGEKPPPKIILNSPTKLMKNLGYGEGYKYDHDAKNAFSGQNYFPDGIPPSSFYHPVERGFEREMKKRLDYFKRLKKTASSDNQIGTSTEDGSRRH